MNGVLIFMKHDEIMPYMIMLIIMFMIHNSNMYIYSEWSFDFHETQRNNVIYVYASNYVHDTQFKHRYIRR